MSLKERQCPVSCLTKAYRMLALCQTFYKGEKSDINHVLRGFYPSLNVLRPGVMSFGEAPMSRPASVPFWLERWESHQADVIQRGTLVPVKGNLCDSGPEV